jgi:RES domain-containing protein
MIFRGIAAETLFYRALTPRWAYAPESGAGAALNGGRFNRPGIHARYLADSAEGALREYKGESELLPPATVATYRVSADRVVDFTDGYVAGLWSPIWEDAYCNWQQIALLTEADPAGWVIGDLVIAAGAAGLLYRSVRHPDTTCLVLYPAGSGAFSAPVYDPSDALPKNQDSWQKANFESTEPKRLISRRLTTSSACDPAQTFRTKTRSAEPTLSALRGISESASRCTREYPSADPRRDRASAYASGKRDAPRVGP